MTTVIFVRHGSSTYNADGRMAGFHDAPLSVDGITEARQVHGYLAGVAIAKCYTSPLRRARDTAEVIWAGREGNPEPLSDLRELDMGDFSGRRWQDVQLDFSSLFEPSDVSFWDLFTKDRIAHQEPYRRAIERVMGVIRTVAKRHDGECVLIVSHKGVLEVILSQSIGCEPSSEMFEIDNASVTTFRYNTAGAVRFKSVNVRPGRSVL